MIKHIVLFKLKDTSPENLAKTAEILKSMTGNVPSALAVEVGTDFLHSERSYDVALTVTLESKEMLDVYQKDAYHCTVVKPHMHAVRSASVALDYEL